MSRTGPTTKDTTTVALGLAQIRVGASAGNIANIQPALSSSNSMGALANTKFSSQVDYWRLESGFPLMEDMSIPIREKAAMECAFKEINPVNVALAKGTFIASGEAHSGEVALGNMKNPDFVRMEACYTYPDGTTKMYVIFPRANVVSNVEMDLKAEDAAAVPVTFEAKRADSEIVGGNAVWDAKPLGRIFWSTT